MGTYSIRIYSMYHYVSIIHSHMINTKMNTVPYSVIRTKLSERYINVKA